MFAGVVIAIGRDHTAATTPATDHRPNIVVIIADDLGYGETEAMGNTQIPTPAIQSLARDGVTCMSGYVTSSYCSPSRAGLMAGRYQSRFGYDHNPTGKRNLIPEAGLPESEMLFPAILAEAGYDTGLFGKWHLGTTDGKQPIDRGFDRFYGFLHEGHFYVPPSDDVSAGRRTMYSGVLTMVRDRSIKSGQRRRDGNLIRGNYAPVSEPAYDVDNPLLRNDSNRSLIEINEPRYLTDAITDEAVEFMASARERPYLAVISYNAVHSPMQSKLAVASQFKTIEDIQRRIFAGMLMSLDEGVGRITKVARQFDKRETLIVFISDNGGPTRELTSRNTPLRGEKGSLYEGGVRVPMIWSMPGRLPSGKRDHRVTLSLDIAATALELAGIPRPATFDGHSIIGWMSDDNASSPHQDVFWRMPRGKAALRSGRYKLVRPRKQALFELYDLELDLTESTDIALREPDLLGRLVERWQRFNSQMAPPIDLRSVDFDPVKAKR
ncbi:MAG: sulfatase-like hydrolase/transferase [Planctomycetota bacterium]